MKSESINKIREKFDNEWLLVSVEAIDVANGVPTKGTLIAHSPRKEDIHQESMKYQGTAYVVYSEDWPEDLAACFYL